VSVPERHHRAQYRKNEQHCHTATRIEKTVDADPKSPYLYQ
jgi:hypothetical protein